jgi:NADH dehydrogenase
VLAAIDRPETGGRIYEVGGPQVKSFRELMEFVLSTIGRHRPLVPIPFEAASVLGAIFEFGSALHKPALTRDQVELLRHDNVVSDEARRDGRTFGALGIDPAAMEAIVPSYLWRFRKAGQFTHQMTDVR